MNSTLFLAWRYVTHHKFKTILMVACLVLTALMPIVLSILLSSFNRQIVARAESTPLVVGAKGSRVDLTMHAIYFKTKAPGEINRNATKVQMTNGQWKDLVGDNGQAIPIHSRITARGVPVVGTSLGYFEYRNLELETGQGLTRLGDCVLGSRVARRLKLGVGDSLLTDRENLMDLAGKYPLKMRVGGILKESRTADDDVIFVDLKTAWVVEGFGHGHDDVQDEVDDTPDDDLITVPAAVLPYIEITDETASSFHFHGSFDEFPITAMIVVPRDEKGAALMLGRFQNEAVNVQMSEPPTVVVELMDLVFRVQRFFNANAILISLSTALLITLVVMLSIRLRQTEMETMYKIGCGKGTMATMVAGELAIVFLLAASIVATVGYLTALNADRIVQSLLA